MKILAAVDGSSYTKRMLAYIAAHDEWLGAQHDYTVVHVVPAVPSRAAAALGKVTLKAHYEEESEKVFKPIRAFLARQGMASAHFVAKVGAPAEKISSLAEKGGFDLIVLGTRGQGSLASLVMGSVATRVVATCRTPVLLIR